MKNSIGLFLLALLLASPAHALVTAYVSFEHPDGWRCELSQGVWICQSTLEQDRKESVVLSIATMATEWDTLENYEEYLKQPRTIQDEDGRTLTSQVRYVRKRNINGTWWIDSLQKDSELPGFWARYVATVQNKLAILITYIVSDERYAQLAPQFERMVSSLKPNAEFDLNIATKQGDGPLPGSEKLGLTQSIIKSRLAPRTKKKDAPEEETPEGEGMDTGTTVGVLGGAGAVIYLILRRRKKKPSARTPEEPRRRTG
jgi:hypothetical protein